MNKERTKTFIKTIYKDKGTRIFIEPVLRSYFACNPDIRVTYHELHKDFEELGYNFSKEGIRQNIKKLEGEILQHKVVLTEEGYQCKEYFLIPDKNFNVFIECAKKLQT